MAEILGETASARTPEEVAAILRRLEEAANPGSLAGYMEEATNPSHLSEYIQSGNSTGVDDILDAAAEVANETNATYSDEPNSLGDCIITSIFAAITVANV